MDFKSANKLGSSTQRMNRSGIALVVAKGRLNFIIKIHYLRGTF